MSTNPQTESIEWLLLVGYKVSIFVILLFYASTFIFPVPRYPLGEIPTVRPNTIFKGRFSLWEAGIHPVPMGAIASNIKEGNSLSSFLVLIEV